MSPAEPRGHRRTGDDAAEFVAGDVGAIGCVNAEHRLDRVRAFVKIQDGCSFSCAFCVIPLVRGATPEPHTAAAVLGEIRRRVDQGHREIVLTGVNLGCFRDRAAGYTLARLVREAGATPGSRGCALVDRGQPRRRRARRGRDGDAHRLAAPARAAAVRRRRRAARDGTPLHGRAVRAQARPARRPQPDDRRDRRLPGRGRRGPSADALARRAAGDDEGARLPVLAPARHTHRGRGQRPSRGEARARPAASSPLRRALPSSLVGTGRGSDRVLVDRPGRGYADDYTPWLVEREGR